MKKHILLLALLVSIIGYTQNGINYKALIKGDLGNAIVNSSVDIKFQILESDALVNIYEETHSPTTDGNGIIIVNIGEGTIISGIFNDINWGEDDHFLNVKINTGSGFVDLGTTQFSAVPHAFHAKKAANVKGLEAIDEGSGIGWRLIGRNINNYNNIGFNAIDLSFIDDPNLGLGATGNYAFSLGHNGTASGEHSFVFGNQNYALNDYAIVLGNNNSVSGLNSTAIGGINQADGDYAFAMGLQNEASANNSVAIGTNVMATGEYAVAMGQNTTASGENSTAFGRNTDAIGANSVAMGRGAEAQGNFSFAFGDESEAQGNNSIAMGDDSFATADYATAIGRDAWASGESSFAVGYNTRASDSYATAMGNETEASGFSSFAVGSDNISSGNGSVAMGAYTTASGETSFSQGNSNIASGHSSVAMGIGTIASGSQSTAFGHLNEASGQYSMSMGSGTIASGNISTAIGRSTNAESYASLAIGRNNIGNGSSNSWVITDPVFEIGIGTSNATRSNAFTVLKNGNIGIGTHTPQELLHIAGGRLRVGTETIEDTGNNQLAFNASVLPDMDNSFRLGNASNRWIGIWATDGTINTSDRREKKNIKNLNYGLAEILKMQPVSFNWKSKNNPDTKLGLIAQDLQILIPEVVKTHTWETDEKTGQLSKKELDRLGVYYSDLIPVLIKAIQEQNRLIENQKKDISLLKSEVSVIKDLLTELKITEQ